MLGLIIDTAVLYGVIAIVVGEAPEMYSAAFLSLGFAVALIAASLLLGPAGGWIALGVVTCLLGVALSAMFGASLKRAVVGSVCFVVYKIVAGFALAAMMR